MSRFEEYGLYAANKSFLLSENVLTFTDLDGRLMALKPDVTLGIAKNTKAGRERCEKVYTSRACAARTGRAIRIRRSARWGWSAWARWTTA